MIEKYGGWSVSGNGSNSWSVEEKMGRVLRDLNVQTLLQVTVGTDLEDSSKHILNVSITMVFSHTSYHTKAFFLLCGLFPKLIHTSLTWDRQVQFRRLFFLHEPHWVHWITIELISQWPNDPLVLRVCSAASSSVRVNSLTRRLLFIHPTFHDLDQMHRLFWWILMTLTVNQVQPDQFNRYRSIWVNLAHVKNRIWSWLGFKNIWLITSTFPNPSIRISIFCMKFPIFPWIWLTGVPGEKSMIEPHCGAHW